MTTHWQAGGSERNIKHHLECLRDAGHTVELAVGTPQTVDLGFPRDVAVHTIPSLCRRPGPLRDAHALRDLKKLLRLERFDVVHTHLSKAGMLGRLAARHTGARIWHTAHGPQMLANAVFRGAERRALNATDRMFFVGHDLCAQYQRAFSVLPRCDVIRSPIDLDTFSAVAPADPRTHLTNVLIATRLVAGKGLERLPELARMLPESMSFTIAGDGPLMPRLENAVERENLSQRLRLTGYVPDIERLMRDSHLLLNLSATEGLPQVVVQAVAAGRPVVALEANGVSEVIEKGVTGFIAASHDIGEVALRLRALAENRDLLERMSKACSATDLSEWHPATICRQHREALADLAAAPSRGDGRTREGAGV